MSTLCPNHGGKYNGMEMHAWLEHCPNGEACEGCGWCQEGEWSYPLCRMRDCVHWEAAYNNPDHPGRPLCTLAGVMVRRTEIMPRDHNPYGLERTKDGVVIVHECGGYCQKLAESATI